MRVKWVFWPSCPLGHRQNRIRQKHGKTPGVEERVITHTRTRKVRKRGFSTGSDMIGGKTSICQKRRPGDNMTPPSDRQKYPYVCVCVRVYTVRKSTGNNPLPLLSALSTLTPEIPSPTTPSPFISRPPGVRGDGVAVSAARMRHAGYSTVTRQPIMHMHTHTRIWIFSDVKAQAAHISLRRDIAKCAQNYALFGFFRARVERAKSGFSDVKVAFRAQPKTAKSIYTGMDKHTYQRGW
jgi:hypothetical protein